MIISFEPLDNATNFCDLNVFYDVDMEEQVTRWPELGKFQNKSNKIKFLDFNEILPWISNLKCFITGFDLDPFLACWTQEDDVNRAGM